jgi:glycosyltransferase involved in cell wall biosynthesis
VHLWLHGANLEQQKVEFQRQFNDLIDATAANVTLMGRYSHDELPRLMANVDWVIVPSVWWENSPMVIQESFLHGRPVICSDIGGMAEKVSDGVNGLHFRAGNAANLAATIRRAVGTPGLWESLRDGTPDVPTIENQVVSLSAIYRSLLNGGEPRSEHRGNSLH